MKLMPRTRLGVAWRAILALVLVVGCAAAATATAGLLQVKTIVGYISQNKALSHVAVTLPAPGKPETLFLIGADRRYNEGSGIGNTDTMMLVRIDDSSSTINALSVPRDLGVQIDGSLHKLNAAYADGGPNLLLRTLQTQVFPGLDVTHILVLDFAGFANLINQIGCVYGQIDHRYYNYNDGTASTDFSNIDLQPGYQKMCGGSGSNLGGADTALAFVRFRHNDSDIVREARQQDFLRWAKQGYSSSQLLSNRTTLLKTFGKAIQSDHSLQTVNGLLDLFNLAINADGSSIKSIPFPYGPTATSPAVGDYLTYSPTASEQAYAKFMTPTPTAATPPTRTSTTPKTAHKVKHYKLPEYMQPDPNDGKSQADQLGNAPGLPIFFPNDIPDNYAYCFAVSENCSEGYAATVYAHSYPRSYAIDGPGAKRYPSYVFTLAYTSGGIADLGTGDFVTVQGTTWQDPPLLRSPTSTEVVKGKLLDIYKQGGAISTVSWHTKQAVYWISNTLEDSVPNGQMIAMAASFTRA
jgi:polyisoprenyl-teichoic acid--peptidoglycan teichoic acid transferase